MLNEADWVAIQLTIKLATIVTILLLLISTPIAWWLAHTRCRLKVVIESLVALPLVLPPSVLGFYLLIAMGTHGPVGQFTEAIGLGTLAFSFSGLVIASVFYSLPFVVQPIHIAFENIGRSYYEAAAMLRAGPIDRFFSIAVPMALPGFLTAAVLGFAHTVGEFGVVLMIGGNIPGVTRVVSVQIYDYVEAIEYGEAHNLAMIMLMFSFVTLLLLYTFNPNKRKT
ncbi:molybdate ABC transporter permease subunit [Methylophaga sp.]|uniref:molybdate ABC transporter permease subunit n=1 Tax=Methylophaga sp. TaxID=2024840 RepID=UPI002725A3EC|nr:molybdate ABC transporter permease subunit [Methylophaga sp.]MDO8828091.1 molybdate ABC transporter permease subunit [Methylophaga sp.]